MFYVLLYNILIILYKLLLVYPVIFNILSILILLITIIINEKFTKVRKIIFILICVCQYIIYIYLDLIIILLIKDLFWYSVILNMAFIWHHLILISLYNIYEKRKNDYMCYIISRIDLLTSLSLISIIIRWIFLVIWRYYTYCKDCYNVISEEDITSSKYCIIFCWINIIDIIFAVINNILNYFIRIFSLYSLYIMGLKKIKWSLNKELINNILFIILFIILSLLLGVPRIYLIWIYLVVISIYKKIKTALKYSYIDKKVIFMIKFWYNFLSYISLGFFDDFRRYPSTEHWYIFDYDIYNDYLCFLDNNTWLSGDGYYLFDLCDVCDIFIYQKGYRMKINTLWVGHMCDPGFMEFDEILGQENIINYKIKCNIKEMVVYAENLNNEGYFNDRLMSLIKINFWTYILGFKKNRIYLL